MKHDFSSDRGGVPFDSSPVLVRQRTIRIVAMFWVIYASLLVFPCVASSEEASPLNGHPKLSLLDVEPVARKALIETLGEKDGERFFCTAVFRIGKNAVYHSAPRVIHWSTCFQKRDGVTRDVCVGAGDGEISVSGESRRSERETPVMLSCPIGYGLKEAWKRLGPNRDTFVCVGGSYWQEKGGWTYTFQDINGTFPEILVYPNGNVRGFEEASVAGAAANERPILDGMPDKPGDPLPYGTEVIAKANLKVEKKDGMLTISMTTSQWKKGFVAAEADSKWVNGTLFLIYRMRYRFGFGGTAEQKQIIWKVKAPSGDQQNFRVLHKPDQVIIPS